MSRVSKTFCVQAQRISCLIFTEQFMWQIILQGQFNNTIIVYLSDNGAPYHAASYNWPMRGSKDSLWEGGVRSHTIFVYPKKTTTVNATWSHLMHPTDWYPTFLRAAQGESAVLPPPCSIFLSCLVCSMYCCQHFEPPVLYSVLCHLLQCDHYTLFL